MTNRLRGALILVVVTIIATISFLLISKRPSPDKLVDEIAAIKVDAAGNFDVEAASKKISLLNHLYKEFPDDPRIVTLTGDLFASMRTNNANLNEALRLYREASSLISKLPSEQSPIAYIYQIIKNHHGEPLDASFQPELKLLFQQRSPYQHPSTFLETTVMIAGLYPDENWRTTIFETASGFTENQDHLTLAKEIVVKLDVPFSLTGTNIKTEKSISTNEFPGNKVVLFVKKDFDPNRLKSLVRIQIPRNSQLILITEQHVDPKILESTTVPILFPTSPLLQSNFDDFQLLSFLINSKNQLIGIENPYLLSQYRFPE